MELTRPGRVSRRTLLGAAVLTPAALVFAPSLATTARRLPAVQSLPKNVTIDLVSEPPTLDPALNYDVDGWSVIHSIYDALVQLGSGGALEMVLAESLTQTDPLTWEITLRPGVTFHNGEPLDVTSITFSLEHLVDPKTASLAAGDFAVISEVEEVDAHTARLHLASPAPWLPSLLAPWLPLLPPIYAGDPANDFVTNPVGTGPYRFVQWDRGSKLLLARNVEYFGGGAKGTPIAENVKFRFVHDGKTRATDAISGTSQIVVGIAMDELATVAETATVVAQPIAGCSFIRIPTDVAPFDNAQVRQAMNHAVDVQAIVTSLIGGNGKPLANFFVPGGMGFDEDLAPIVHDPALAKQLLADAGYPDGFSTTLAYSSIDRADLAGAIAAQLAAVDIQVELQAVELTTFNAQWQNPESAPLRLVSWRPVLDPYTLLSLVVSNEGSLSRYDDPEAQALIDAGAIEIDPSARNDIYRELGRVLQQSPATIYLWNKTTFFALAPDAPKWTPRVDDWILPLVVEN